MPLSRIRDKREALPEELVELQGHKVEHRCAKAYEELLCAAREDGFAAPIFSIVSGYRADAEQEKLFAAAVKRYGSEALARKWVAPPTSSPHRTGRALDLILSGELGNASQNARKLRTSSAGLWLAHNAERYGFARYPAEPWHLEFNPEGT